MTLHLLVVEDDADFVDELDSIVAGLAVDTDVRVARSRDQAYEMLESGFLDLVILDLKLPTVTGALDADSRHGHAVFERIREGAPGTPIFVLTGSPAEDFVAQMLKNQQHIDIWGDGRRTGTILFLKKYEIDSCPAVLAPIAQAIDRLSDIELEADGVTLSLAEDRLIRIFAKKVQGVRCAVSELGGGLSGARVIRVRVTNHQGVLVHDAVAKLSTLADIRRENACYESQVVRLAAGATPRKLRTLSYGAHDRAGIFFGLAEGSDQNAFDVASGSPDQVKNAIASVEAATAPWITGVPETRMAIGDIRRRILDDDTFEGVCRAFNLPWIPSFEDREIQARWGCSHGDLHGKNIFVSPTGTELIDYEDVDSGPASLDPVTLELSLLFHPSSPISGGDWPSSSQAKAWGKLEAYIENCPFPDFVRECRAWALRAAVGNREVAASAYSYLVRQLKYDDTDKDRVLALLEGVRSLYEGNT